MNFLAHLLLSGTNSEVIFGNFIGDSIKGSQYKAFPKNIQKGALLHRFIDSYTDEHELIKSSKHLLNPKQEHYKGVIIDVFNDHFLSKHWKDYHNQSIPKFLDDFKDVFNSYEHLLNQRWYNYYTKFITLDFMAHYSERSGIEKTLKALEKRIKRVVPLAEAMADFDKYYDQFDRFFSLFFPDLKQQCDYKLQTDLKPTIQ